jgi:hypothetical protein
MKQQVNLTPLQKDYAVYLPAISSFYSTYVAKQREGEFVPKDRIPAGFDRGIEGMNFLNPEQGYFTYKYGLYSAVNVDQTMEPKFAYCISKYWTDALSWGWDTIVFNSDLYYDYEEAQLTCLKKLIEISKNK